MSTTEAPKFNQVNEDTDNFDRFDPKHFEADAKRAYRFGAIGRAALMLSRGRRAVLGVEKVKAKELAENARQASVNRAPKPGQAAEEGLFGDKVPSHRTMQTDKYFESKGSNEDLEPVDPVESTVYQTPQTNRRALSPHEATSIDAGLFSREEINRDPANDPYAEEPFSNDQKDYDRAA